MEKNKKGFTLVELLIVIGVLGVLSAAVVVVLNPAELLRQARDSQRLQDMSTINSALALYVTDYTSAAITATTFHSGITTTAWTCGGDTPAGRSATQATAQAVDSTGWVDVNFGNITGGSPLAVLPVDPTNDITYHYCYEGHTTETWELGAYMESTKFSASGNSDVETTDGGDDDAQFEIGTDPALDLM